MIKDNKRTVTAKNSLAGGISLTQVNRPFRWRTTFNAGYCVPIWCDEVYPSQKKSVNLGELVRGITPLGPTMDNAYIDIFFFSVPKRLLWDHWEEFIAGYNKEAWAQDVTYTVPKIKFRAQTAAATSDSAYVHSFLDYLYGACDVVTISKAQQANASLDPTKPADKAELDSREAIINEVAAIDALYPRAFVKIWNDWFRSETVDDEYELYTGDNDQYTDEFAFNLLSPLELPKSNKYHNRITDALYSPTKGPDVLIPMNDLKVGVDGIPSGNEYLVGEGEDSFLDFANSSMQPGFVQGVLGQDDNAFPVIAKNVSNTIRMLRIATQTELLLARDARGGTRYVESLLSHFGVHNGDARMQRSEYLGSRHIPLNIVQVTNTAQSPGAVLGNVGGQMLTKDNGHYFTKSFSEHCIVFAIATVRYNISYSGGVRKMYQRFNRFDHIWPEFKHIGDVKLLDREIDYSMLSSYDIDPDAVFGYTPYGSEMREGYNANNGLFRGQLGSNGLAYLTYQEIYGAGQMAEIAAPSLSSEYLKVSETPMYNTMTVDSGPQFYALFDLQSVDVIPLDPTSDPGLMDHF